jgi:hypothetical protein
MTRRRSDDTGAVGGRAGSTGRAAIKLTLRFVIGFAATGGILLLAHV